MKDFTTKQATRDTREGVYTTNAYGRFNSPTAAAASSLQLSCYLIGLPTPAVINIHDVCLCYLFYSVYTVTR